ncbi:MAG: GWxTD domain-containing protein [Acidobacteriota bacterium]
MESLPAVLLLLLTVSGASPEGKPDASWSEGPVRYLLTSEEERAFRKLDSEDEIRAFVEQFWDRRDPDPLTPQNEFREEFRRRVLSANRLFTETTKPGWKTDRGKIYVLLGPPDEIAASPVQAHRRGQTSWAYRHPPQPELGPFVVVRFDQGADGEYRLAPDAFAESQLVRLSSPASLPRTTTDFAVPRPSSGLEARMELSRLQAVPMPLSAPRVSVSWSTLGPPFRACTSHYLSEDALTLVALTFEVDPTFLREEAGFRPAKVRALGHVAQQGGSKRFDLGQMTVQKPFPETGSSRPLRFQAMRTLEPGPYRAYFALVDGRERLRGSYQHDFVVLDLAREGLTLSSMTLVEEIEEIAPSTSAPRHKPFIIGNLRVVPRCRAVFDASEQLGLYYQIYEGPGAPAEEEVEYEIEYRFQLLLDGKRFQVGAPLRLHGARRLVQGQTFQLSSWPPGEYAVSLTVRDPSGGSQAEEELIFEIR